jgi:hypothetical protein
MALREDFSFPDVMVLNNISSMLHCDQLVFFEVEIGKKLVGFIVVHELFIKKPIAIIGCFDKSFSNITDALYWAIIQHYKHAGSQWIGFGYSLDKGLLFFKTKWGGARTNSPFYQQIWKRKGFETDSFDCLSWIGRLLENKLNHK